MLMDDDQLSSAELRELLIRHVRSNPFDSRNAPISEALVNAWTAAYVRDNGKMPHTASGQDAYDLMKGYFSQAFISSAGDSPVYPDEMWVWPVCLTSPLKSDIEYPVELLLQVGLAVGNEVGSSVQVNREIRHHPKN